MASRYSIKIFSLTLMLVSALGLALLGSPVVEAEEGGYGPPTPTNVPSGGSGGGDERSSGPAEPPRSVISGYVYDYSQGNRAGGVKVILDGGGWQLDGVTDSNGYYRFGGLGQGKAVLRLDLPDEAHVVTPDWPLSMGVGEGITANLGFFWGEEPPIPVLFSSELSGTTLTLTVENQTVEDVTGAQISITLPSTLEALPGAKTSQGDVSYSDNKLTVNLGEIAAGETVSTRIVLAERAAAAPEIDSDTDADPGAAGGGIVQALFTYDQEITPQRWQLSTDEAVTAAGETPDVMDAGAETTSVLPVTGGLEAESLLAVLAILLVGGLVFAGWRSGKARR
jgi:hypothetical protein